MRCKLRDLPVILLSARAGEEAQIEGFEAGASDYLIKPFSAREMVSRISANLKMARMRREANDALRQRTEQFETLLNAAPIGVYLIDADFRLRAINPAARPVFGDIPDLVGRDFADVLHILWPQSFAGEVAAIFKHTLATGEPYLTPENIEQRLDRNVTEYYEWQIHRIRLPDGRYGVVCYFRDISFQVIARLRQKLLLDELNHRVKNTLATVQSIATQTLRTAASTTEAREVLEGRLIALSKTHDVLTREHWAKADLREIVTAAVAPYSGTVTGARFEIRGPEASVQPKAAVALAMAFHELSTNAVKYGALSNETGRVAISWTIENGVGTLRWVESGGPVVKPPTSRGFGSRLIERGLAHDLAGEARLDFVPTGVVCIIMAPAGELLANVETA